MLKISITGSTGFVGKNLSLFLSDAGYNVKAIDLRKGVSNDIFNDCDVFIHLAGIAHDLNGNFRFNDYINTNYLLTKNIYNIFLNTNSKVFIFFSSIKAVADKSDDFVTEETTPNPKTDYGKSKLLAENYILDHAPKKNQKVFILRPCMIHGSNNKGNLNLLFNFIKFGLPWPLGLFENKRSFCGIDNLIFIIKIIISDKNIDSGIYNISDSETLSTNDLIRLISIINKRKVRIFNCPVSIIKMIGFIGDKLHLSINSKKIDKLTENFPVSNRKILNAIKSELPISAKDAFLKTLTNLNFK